LKASARRLPLWIVQNAAFAPALVATIWRQVTSGIRARGAPGWLADRLGHRSQPHHRIRLQVLGMVGFWYRHAGLLVSSLLIGGRHVPIRHGQALLYRSCADSARARV
jgi:hypothetical protein